MGFGLQNRNGVGIGLGSLSSLYCNPVGNTPSLNLNFLGTNTLDPRITFTRASSATYVNGSGLIASATTNTPRFDYDPVTLQPKGLLIEEQRTNLLLYSSNFDNANWTLSNTTVSANVVTAPDGTVSGYSMTGSSSTSNNKYLTQNQTTTTTGNYTGSIYLKAGTQTQVVVRTNDNTGVNGSSVPVNLSNGTLGTVTNYGTNTGGSATITSVGNGWYRVILVSNYVAALTSIQLNAWFDTYGPSTSTSTFYIWGAQLEAGAFATSYIPTVAAQVTRAADNAVMTGTNFSSWFNAAEGTWAVQDVCSSYANSPVQIGLQTGGTGMYSNGAGLSQWWNGTSSVATANGIAFGSLRKESFGYTASTRAICLNGGTVATDANVPWVSAPTSLYLGSLNGSNQPTTQFVNGHIRSITYWPRRLSNAELQAITV